LTRGEIWWADLPEAVAAEPGGRRPVLVISNDDFNKSRIQTVIVVIFTTNLTRADAPGNLFLTSQETGLTRDGVVNVSQVLTVDKAFLTEFVSTIPEELMDLVDDGLRLALKL
jgi:mRNA interferase MazF